MSSGASIEYLAHSTIDKTKWDACMDRAENGLVYGYSYYLDRMADDWDGLVMGDYEAVMPLTYKKKYGIYYLAQPFLCAQLGIFGNKIDAGILENFLKAIPEKFRYRDIYLNDKNNFPVKGFNLYLRKNFVLDLNSRYSEIATGYRENTVRNIKKAMQAGCEYQKNFEVEELISLARDQIKQTGRQVEENISRFRDLYTLLNKENKAEVYGVFSREKKLLSSAAFFYSHHRAYYILVGNDPESKELGASHALVDYFIRENAGRDLILDFEGSDLKSLAFFYRGFGAKEENYPSLKQNLLPFYLKWLKK